MQNAIQVNPPAGAIKAQIHLASSKSESNRAQIINALTGFKCQLQNLSTARDTQTMMRLLASDGPVADVIDAGTTMRFLTAYFAATGQRKTMTGTPRMCQRPIGILVDALRTLGAKVTYLQEDGYPPIELEGFSFSNHNHLSMRGDVSSQYISALLMVAPTLPNGLVISLLGDVGSVPYITMTLEQMRYFGIETHADWQQNTISVAPQKYVPRPYAVESDWSGASYWFSVVALAAEAEIELLGLKQNSLQGDSAIVQIMDALGVEATYTGRGFLLTKKMAVSHLTCDFANCPDLAQTVAVCCVMKGISATFTGIESLKIKETDRVLALQTELQKIGGALLEVIPNQEYRVERRSAHFETPTIDTYDDHRMAMAFAPVGMLAPIVIDNPEVVVKSYPSFWDDLRTVTELL